MVWYLYFHGYQIMVIIETRSRVWWCIQWTWHALPWVNARPPYHTKRSKSGERLLLL